MNKRSLEATKVGIDKANRQITDKTWSRKDLADKVVVSDNKTGISSQPVHHFFSGQPVDRSYFVGICKALGARLGGDQRPED